MWCHMTYGYPEIMCLTLSPTSTMNNRYYVKGKSYDTSESCWETLYDEGVIYTGIHKSKYHWADASWSMKTKNNVKYDTL